MILKVSVQGSDDVFELNSSSYVPRKSEIVVLNKRRFRVIEIEISFTNLWLEQIDLYVEEL
jgi:hypothetical protein